LAHHAEGATAGRQRRAGSDVRRRRCDVGAQRRLDGCPGSASNRRESFRQVSRALPRFRKDPVMARKPSTSAASAKKKSTKRAAGTSSGRTARKIASAEDQADVAGQASATGVGAAARGGKADMGTMAALLSPEQAIELYKTNARMALDVINAAIESTAKLRKL